MSSDPDALNRWLAEHVLGLTVFKCFGYWWAVPPTCKKGDALPATYILPDPYRSFADCEALLDQVERDGYGWSLGFNNTRYTAALWKGEDVHESGRSYASTRTAALCLAVAKSYGMKELT